jgi:hypothetical protein
MILTTEMSGPNARLAPKWWEAVVADPAERHAHELERRVRDLRRLAGELRG